MSISANPFAHHQLFPLSCGSDNSENIKSNTRQTYQSLLTPLHSINCSPYPVGMTIVKPSNQTLDKHINRCQHLCTASKQCSPYPVGMTIMKPSSQTLDKHINRCQPLCTASKQCSPYPVGMTIVKTSSQTPDKHQSLPTPLHSINCSPYPVALTTVKTSSQTLDKHQSLPTPLHSIKTVFPVSSISGSNSARNTKTYQSHLPRA